jgi:uncharacterized iron-regulated protein
LIFARGVDLPYPAGAEAALVDELVESHCGHLPKEHAAGFVTAQRLRDGEMAAQMASGATPSGAVLIAGNGHVRADRGVPWLLAAREPTAKLFALAFVEVEAGLVTPESYAALFHAKSLPVDAVWFTPALDDEDPCAGMKAP